MSVTDGQAPPGSTSTSNVPLSPPFMDASNVFQTNPNQVHRSNRRLLSNQRRNCISCKWKPSSLWAPFTLDSTKFNHILGSLDPQFLQPVVDIIENPAATNKYETLKTRILAEFTHSDQQKLRILLKETELGDNRPSQLLRKMRELSNNVLSDDALKTLWIERLPEQIRPVV